MRLHRLQTDDLRRQKEEEELMKQQLEERAKKFDINTTFLPGNVLAKRESLAAGVCSLPKIKGFTAFGKVTKERKEKKHADSYNMRSRSEQSDRNLSRLVAKQIESLPINHHLDITSSTYEEYSHNHYEEDIDDDSIGQFIGQIDSDQNMIKDKSQSDLNYSSLNYEGSEEELQRRKTARHTKLPRMRSKLNNEYNESSVDDVSVVSDVTFEQNLQRNGSITSATTSPKKSGEKSKKKRNNL